ncbi:MAG: hypothetical protein HDKAJFGB_02545 [Anaerolineae bacterium]|nr:hypothetical protein [Anaerolineae bacterium]
MEIHELVIEMKLLERRLTLYEEKVRHLERRFLCGVDGGTTCRIRCVRRNARGFQPLEGDL